MLNPMNEYSAAFPILEWVHLSGIVCGVGTAAFVNLRLLGVGPAQDSPAQLWKDVTPWTVVGLTVAILSGFLLFTTDPEMYFANTIFRFKLSVLVLAILFYFTMVRRAASRGTGSSMVAFISLGMWALVPVGGIFIGFAG
jgi:hypothetical protein